jgi:6-phosphogluconolactonase
MKIQDYPDREMLAINLANILAGELEKCLLHHDVATFAVPGGTTPGPVFDALCAADIDWSRVHVMLTDERWVPEDHARSNAALVRTRLLTDRAAAARFVPFFQAGTTAAQAASRLSAEIAPTLPISLLLLGMGEDMHTASLFPAMPGLEAALDDNAAAVMAVAPQDQPEERITLTAPVLDGALSKHLVIFGDAKRAAVRSALDLPAQKAPIGAVIRGGTVHWAA